MYKKLIPLLIILSFISACGQTSEKVSGNEEIIEMIDVELTAPTEVTAGETVEFQAVVSQGSEKVENAEEVAFEIWQTDAKEKSEKIDAEHLGDGVYSIEKTFDEKGEFHVQSHVTANSMHVMPEKVFTVTGGTEATSSHHDQEDATETGSDHHHAETEVDLNLLETAKAGEQVTFEATIDQAGEPLTEANISLEIPEEENKDPLWVQMSETEPGIYTGNATISTSGSVPITVHIKKGEFHDHTEKTVEVNE